MENEMKTSNILLKAKATSDKLWRLACVSENIPTNSMFVEFSRVNPYCARLNTAARKLQILCAIQESFNEAEDLINLPRPNLAHASLVHAYNVAMKGAF
jgi:hypothetical protein